VQKSNGKSQMANGRKIFLVKTLSFADFQTMLAEQTRFFSKKNFHPLEICHLPFALCLLNCSAT
jgi:hypothetical protein